MEVKLKAYSLYPFSKINKMYIIRKSLNFSKWMNGYIKKLSLKTVQ